MGKRITIAGRRVHDIGYRYFLMEAALSFGIEKMRAVNRFNHLQEVIAYIDGEEEQLQDFIEFSRASYPEGAEVEEVTWDHYSGHVPKIDSFALVFNIGQSRKFIEIGRGIDNKMDSMLEKQDSMLEKQDSMLEKQDSMLEKQDSMLEKQDSMLEKQDSMLEKQDSMLEKQDSMLEKQDVTISVIREEGEKTRGELSSVIKEEGEKTRQEHVKTRELSHEIFYSEVQTLREEIRDLRSTVEEIKKKVGIA